MQARWPTINVSTFGKSGHTLDNNSRTFTGYTLNKFSRGCTQGGACIVEVEQFFCNLARYVTRPTFLGVECDQRHSPLRPKPLARRFMQATVTRSPKPCARAFSSAESAALGLMSSARTLV